VIITVPNAFTKQQAQQVIRHGEWLVYIEL